MSKGKWQRAKGKGEIKGLGAGLTFALCRLTFDL
jgi:hypothetical protein